MLNFLIPTAYAGTLFDLPTTSDFIAEVGSWSSALFTEFEDILFMIIGVGLVVLLLGVVIKIFK